MIQDQGPQAEASYGLDTKHPASDVMSFVCLIRWGIKDECSTSVSSQNTGEMLARDDRLTSRAPSCGVKSSGYGVVSVCLPGRGEHIHAFQTLRTIHLGEHLIYNPICDTSTVVSSAWDMSKYHSTPPSKTNRFGAIESNSSKNRTQGFAAVALSNKSLT